MGEAQTSPKGATSGTWTHVLWEPSLNACLAMERDCEAGGLEEFEKRCVNELSSRRCEGQVAEPP